MRKLVAKSIGIDAAHVIVGATHCHTGPVIPADPASINSGSYPKSKGGQILAGYIAKQPAFIAEALNRPRKKKIYA